MATAENGSGGANTKFWWPLGCCGIERRSKRTATDVENQDAPKRPRITENTAIPEGSRDSELSGETNRFILWIRNRERVAVEHDGGLTPDEINRMVPTIRDTPLKPGRSIPLQDQEETRKWFARNLLQPRSVLANLFGESEEYQQKKRDRSDYLSLLLINDFHGSYGIELGANSLGAAALALRRNEQTRPDNVGTNSHGAAGLAGNVYAGVNLPSNEQTHSYSVGANSHGATGVDLRSNEREPLELEELRNYILTTMRKKHMMDRDNEEVNDEDTPGAVCRPVPMYYDPYPGAYAPEFVFHIDEGVTMTTLDRIETIADKEDVRS